MRIVIRKRELPYRAQDRCLHFRAGFRALELELDGIKRCERLEDLEAFVNETRTARLVQNRDRLANVRTK